MKTGFIDLQVNGHGGVDLLTAKSIEDIRIVSRSMFTSGVIGYLPTVITAPNEMAVRAIKLIEEVRRDPLPGEAKILGIHLEGPFISRHKCGAHPLINITDPDMKLMGELLSAGTISMVTLAPELPGAINLIEFLSDSGIVVSLGHSNATVAEANAGFDAGAKTVTHIWNAMGKPGALVPGVGEAALARSDIQIQMIVDKVHLPLDLIESTIRKSHGRFIVTNDPVAPAGVGEGRFRFGEMLIEVQDGVARKMDGTLAGGVGLLTESYQILEGIGIEESEILASMTTRPASLIGYDYDEIASEYS